jgi:hypothetical protein
LHEKKASWQAQSTANAQAAHIRFAVMVASKFTGAYVPVKEGSAAAGALTRSRKQATIRNATMNY